MTTDDYFLKYTTKTTDDWRINVRRGISLNESGMDLILIINWKIVCIKIRLKGFPRNFINFFRLQPSV